MMSCLTALLLFTNLGESIVEFGKQYGFNIWDWSAVMISFCSVVVALVSLVVAVKTLASQKKTEKNTLPAINDDVQISLLGQNLRDLYDAYTLIFALDFLLDKYDYKIVPSIHFWQLARLNPDGIHESLFYSSDSRLTPIHQLKTAVQDFNNCLSSLERQLGSNDSVAKKLELDHLYDEVGYFTSLYVKVLGKTFNFTDSQIKEFLNSNFYERRYGKFTLRYMDKYLHDENTEQIVLPYIENSSASKYLEDKYKSFYSLSCVDEYCGTGETDFIKKLSLEVDLVLLNTKAVGFNFELVSEPEEPNSRAWLQTDYEVVSHPFNLSERQLPEVPPSMTRRNNSWIFFIRER